MQYLLRYCRGDCERQTLNHNTLCVSVYVTMVTQCHCAVEKLDFDQSGLLLCTVLFVEFREWLAFCVLTLVHSG